MQIIGVVKDYHQQALSKNYTPIMLIHKDKIDWLPQRYICLLYTSDKAYVIEINDNPSIDHGLEDAIIGDEMYYRLLNPVSYTHLPLYHPDA